MGVPMVFNAAVRVPEGPPVAAGASASAAFAGLAAAVVAVGLAAGAAAEESEAVSPSSPPHASTINNRDEIIGTSIKRLRFLNPSNFDTMASPSNSARPEKQLASPFAFNSFKYQYREKLPADQ